MIDEEQRRVFSKNLNRFIAASGKMQLEIANELGLKTSTLNNWCKGKALPRMSELRMLADYFKAGVTDLIDEKPDSDLIQHYANFVVDIFTNDERFAKLMLQYSDLPDEKKKVLCDFLETFVF